MLQGGRIDRLGGLRRRSCEVQFAKRQVGVQLLLGTEVGSASKSSIPDSYFGGSVAGIVSSLLGCHLEQEPQQDGCPGLVQGLVVVAALG